MKERHLKNRRRIRSENLQCRNRYTIKQGRSTFKGCLRKAITTCSTLVNIQCLSRHNWNYRALHTYEHFVFVALVHWKSCGKGLDTAMRLLLDSKLVLMALVLPSQFKNDLFGLLNLTTNHGIRHISKHSHLCLFKETPWKVRFQGLEKNFIDQFYYLELHSA